MLEIVGIVMFAKHLAGIAENKGRAKGWAALGVLGWIVGEILGAIVGAALIGEGLGLYLTALVGAAIGAGIAWLIVSNLPAEQDSVEGLADDRTYSHADANNPYSPPGFGRRD
jgi:hypothetical protein